MTKKQIAALKRIVDRENFRNNKDKRPAGMMVSSPQGHIPVMMDMLLQTDM